MAHKKEPIPLLSQEDNTQVQHLLEDYHHIAQNLHQSTNQAETENALTEIQTLAEQAQIALLKALSKSKETDAADILTAVNALSSHKEIRKEARRSLIRLEEAKIYPHWTPPIAHAPAVQVSVTNPPRFWKGFVTPTREEGEIQMLLSWEQGYDYGEARMIVFVLDYWNQGIKDVITQVCSKRLVDQNVARMQEKLEVVVDCTLAESKRLLEDALSFNTWSGTDPHKGFRHHLGLIKSLILEVSDPGKDRGYTFINPELTEQEVAINFLGAWSMGDYGLAYDLLSRDNSVSAKQTRSEWIAQHRAWFNEAHPTRLELGFVHERERAQSALWLPNTISTSRMNTRKEIEVGWAVELTETPLSGTLSEMPLGTAVNKETRRHWFWTSYTLVQEQSAWRIQSINDEGAKIQKQSIAELQKHITEYEEALNTLMQKTKTDPQAVIEEIPWRVTQLLHFSDALVTLLPLDQEVCSDAYSKAVMAGNPERTLVYLERMVQRFPLNRGEALRTLGATQLTQAYNDLDQELEKRSEYFFAQAEKSLRAAIEVENITVGHLLLAELLLSLSRNDEAEEEYRLASSLSPNTSEEAAVESGLGNIEMRRNHIEDALPHFQHVTTLDPDYTGIWFNLGFAYRKLGRFAAALEVYQRALKQEPQDERIYTEIVAIYMNIDQKQEARAMAEQGVQINPESAVLHAMFASVLVETGELEAAQRELDEAEEIDPDLDILLSVHEQIQAVKKM